MPIYGPKFSGRKRKCELCALKKRNMTLNEDKTVREVEKITVLGYEIGNGRISPDKKRLQPLLDLAEPKTFKELK